MTRRARRRITALSAIDATVIRLLVVPATMFLLGKANWWTPRWLTHFPDLLEPIEQATSTSS